MLSAHFTSAYLVDDSVMTGGLGNTWNPGSRFSQALASRRGTKFVVGIAVSMLAGNLLAMSKHKLQAGSPFVPSVLTSDPLREVPEYAGPALLKLQPAFPPAAQSFGLLDPKLCYLLDGILFIYGVIVTALFLRAKELNLGRREEYDVLDRRGGLDPEMGGKPRKKNPHEVVYNELRKDKMAEAYSELGMKGENQRRRGKGHDGLYQGLSTATKDTYAALHLQDLPPR
ncbi:T-cell surface glycoprotein CD3 zeta chain, partial [Eschrichtius robustus]|nr:T-cell surface glycoprotein CD3 zeta chain [Eschrichtius robustus]